MLLCDLNCDMGEGSGNDEQILPFITSANIACGYHSGDDMTMNKTVLLAKKYHVFIGAHPSFLDRENFGRSKIKTTPGDIYAIVQKQLKVLKSIAALHEVTLHHVKPHGALYNMAAKDKTLAAAIANAVYDFDETLIVYGLSGSCLISEAKKLGIKTRSEVFADRSYQDDGSLTPRSEGNALLHDIDMVVKQVLQMIREKNVISVSGKLIPILAETICIHGDGDHALPFAKAINKAITPES
ncbi:MAG: LamB/YcsF family protein [Chitinophagaceae bacterium]|nr:LamB/YcsF family protein [Chitinophagaceae bacterium]